MADIPASLLQTLNGPGPQYKKSGLNRFEWAEGSNGAPFSQIVDSNGNPITSANRLPVDAQLTGRKVKDTPDIQTVLIAPGSHVDFDFEGATEFRDIVVWAQSDQIYDIIVFATPQWIGGGPPAIEEYDQPSISNTRPYKVPNNFIPTHKFVARISNPDTNTVSANVFVGYTGV